MGNLERDVVRVMIAALGVAALYDVLFINGGKPAVSLASTGFTGFSAILARVTGQTPPKGF